MGDTRATWRRRLVTPWTFLAAIGAVGLIAWGIAALGQPGAAGVSAASTSTTASSSTSTDPQAACRAPSTASKGGDELAFDWQLAVRLDQGDTAVLLLTSGPHELLCQTTRGADGRYSDAATGLGTLDSTVAQLSIDTGMGPDGNPARLIIAGRVPQGTTSVTAATVDEEPALTAVGGGRYLGWLDGATPLARVTALDSSGAVLATMVDPGGLQAGTAATGLAVRLTNHDQDPYLVVLVVPGTSGGPDGDTPAYLGWLLPAGASGVVSSTEPGVAELQVRKPNCDAVAAWPVGGLSYSVDLTAGVAALTTAEPITSGPTLATADHVEDCFFTGGP